MEISPEDGRRIIIDLQEAHYNAAMNNNNISKSVFKESFRGSRNPMHSCAAGLLSTGEVHGPVTETREALEFFGADRERYQQIMNSFLARGGKQPGLGNSFFRESVDPSFLPVYNRYQTLWNEVHGKSLSLLDDYKYCANEILSELKQREIKLYPNAAGITAAICELLGAIPYFENWFFISGRTRAWLEIVGKEEREKYESKS